MSVSHNFRHNKEGIHTFPLETIDYWRCLSSLWPKSSEQIVYKAKGERQVPKKKQWYVDCPLSIDHMSHIHMMSI